MRSSKSFGSLAAAALMSAVAMGGAALASPAPAPATDPGNMRQKTRDESRTVSPDATWGHPRTKWTVAQDRRRAAKRRNVLRNRKAQRRARG